jgi:mannose-6-phosphate isomerase-like protein (cupin superfamily)
VRRFVTGVNAAGRSCIVEEGEVTLGAVEGMAEVLTASLWATDASPPPAAPRQAGHFIDVRLPPGIVRWVVVDHAPHEATDAAATSSTMHHTNAIDLIFVIAGSTQMILDDDLRDLRPGDCVVMTGVDHAMKAGPDGSRVISVAIGIPTAD